MIQCQLKLKLTPRQEREAERWLRHLTSVWNWAIRKIENDVHDNIYYTPKTFRNLLAGHSKKLGIPSHVIQGTLATAHLSWGRCFKGLARKPRLKGRRNRLNSILFPDPIGDPQDCRVALPGFRSLRFYKQQLPSGKIKCARLMKRASGWYLCLFIDMESNAMPRVASGLIGVDPGFNSLLTLSTGEKIAHPRELETSALRLAQSQRGGNRKLTARIRELVANKRKDRNHKLSRRLVSENIFIAFSKDNIRRISKKFGKSVASSGHYQLRSMLTYKSRTGGSEYVEPDSKKSTITCSTCGAQTGPRGLAGLKVREWDCVSCGTHHDRDINSGMNALISGLGGGHELSARAV